MLVACTHKTIAVLPLNAWQLMVAVKSPPSKRVPVIVKSIDDVIAIAKDDYTYDLDCFLLLIHFLRLSLTGPSFVTGK